MPTSLAHPQTGYVLAAARRAGRAHPPPASHVKLGSPKTPREMRVAHGCPRPTGGQRLWRRHRGNDALAGETHVGGGGTPSLLVTPWPAAARISGGAAPTLPEQQTGGAAQEGADRLCLDSLVVANDVVISKAGGLIVSEVLARNTPMLIIDPIPGQEVERAATSWRAPAAGIQLRIPPEMVPPAGALLRMRRAAWHQMGRQAELMGRPTRRATSRAQSSVDCLTGGNSSSGRHTNRPDENTDRLPLLGGSSGQAWRGLGCSQLDRRIAVDCRHGGHGRYLDFGHDLVLALPPAQTEAGQAAPAMKR